MNNLKIFFPVVGVLLVFAAAYIGFQKLARQETANTEIESMLDIEAENGFASNSAPIDSAPIEKSIAVLPFADLSPEGDQGYFSVGLSDDLINNLSMMPDLQVAGRESSYFYKDRNEVLSKIGDSLQVAHILLGSVRKSDDQLRVTAQLVNASDGFNIWSRTFDRAPSDFYIIQSEITEAVTTALSVTLGAGQFDIPGMTRNLDAYDKTLQALSLYDQFTPDNVYRAINLAEEAVRIDPEYGRAWMLLGSMYDESQMILSVDQAAGFPELSRKSFEKARAVSDEIPELLLVDAGRQRNAGQFLEAERIYKYYFERYGYSSARALWEYAQLLSLTGQVNEAIELLIQAKRQDPLAPRYSYQLAMHLLYANRVEAAQAEAEYGLSLGQGKWFFTSIEWVSAIKMGELDKATTLIKEYYKNETDVSDATISERFMSKLADILSSNDFEGSTEQIIELFTNPSVTPLEKSYIASLIAVMGGPEYSLDYWYGTEIQPAIWDGIYSDMRKLPDFKVLMTEKGLSDYWEASGNWSDYCQPIPNSDDFECK